MLISNKTLQIMLTVTGSLMVAVFILINVIYLYPYDITKIKCPMEVANKLVTPGEFLSYRIVYNKHYDIPEVISQQLEVKQGRQLKITYPPVKSNLKPTQGVFDMNIAIPKNIELGPASVSVILRYRIFWNMRVIDVEGKTESFDIVKSR